MGYIVKSIWTDTSTNITYECIDATERAAQWIIPFREVYPPPPYEPPLYSPTSV